MSAPPLSGEAAVEAAERLATRAHAGAKDKTGHPYIEHPRRVVAHLGPDATWEQRVVAWLHDVVEDTDVPLTQIAEMFGDRIADAVEAITHRPHEPRPEYYARVKANPLALAVKFADLADNTDPTRTAQLDEANRVRLAKKYALAYEVLGA